MSVSSYLWHKSSTGSRTIRCNVCNKTMDRNNAKSHFSGKKHLRMVVTALKAPDYPIARPRIDKNPSSRPFGTKTPPRRYQVELLQQALTEDCVVFLPTGTGKTLVSALVLARMLDANPNYQAVFLVEKTLLVLQQADYLRDELQTPVRRFDRKDNITRSRRPHIASACGDLIKFGKRDHFLWEQDIIVTTVAFYLNLLETGALRWDDVCLVVFDEAHHCVKDHPFNRLLRDYSLPIMQSLRPKILGLTASPADGSCQVRAYGSVRQLLKNLGDARLATVRHFREELESYSSSCKIQTCQDPPDTTEQDLQRHLMRTAAEIFDRVLPQNFKAFTTALKADLDNPSVHWDQISKLTERFVEYAKGADLDGAELAALCLQAFHELQGGGWTLAVPRLTFLQQQLRKQKQRRLLRLENIKQLDAAVDAAAVTHASGMNISGVMSKLVELVVEGLRCSPLFAEGKAVVLVLTSQRSIARSVAEYLDSHIREKMKGIRVASIVGHGSTSGFSTKQQLDTRGQLTGGMTVKQQQNLLKEIKQLRYKVIVATSVAEEGVDLPSCGLVILLAPPSTMTALVQMRGRARLRESEFVVLMREAEQKQKLEALLEREQNMKLAIERILAEDCRSGELSEEEECEDEEQRVIESSEEGSRNELEDEREEECDSEDDEYGTDSDSLTEIPVKRSRTEHL